MSIRSTLRSSAALAVSLLALSGCGLLETTDPTVVEEDDIGNPDGAELLRRHAISDFYDAVGYGARSSGLFSDELFYFPSPSVISSGTLLDELLMDQRDRSQLVERWAEANGQPYASYERARISATQALEWFGRYGVPEQRPYVGQLYAVRGYIMISMAEQICPGFALHGLKDGKPVFNTPLTTEQVLEKALVELDSALAAAGDSTRFLNLARVLRARALLDLGRFEEAAQAAAAVPTEFVYNAEYGPSPGKTNRLRFTFSRTGNNPSVSDREGVNGLDFVSAGDPRVPVTLLGIAHDDATRIYAAAKHQDVSAPIVVASGIEARLIEAEAALKRGDPSSLTILNELRATQITPAMAPLDDPGTPEARVDLLFRERAFWLFLSGHRLGDLRRLVKQYGRDPESVFPTGPYHIGGAYGTAVSLPFSPAGEEWAKTGVTGCIE